MIEDTFDVPFVAELAQREKQIQQHYRPVIGVHKWFARRPGTLFRSLILSEFGGEAPLHQQYFQGHDLSEVTVGDPFMGGGTPLFEANRLGADVVGADVNPMAYWIVRQELAPLDVERFEEAVEEVTARVDETIGSLYRTECVHCHEPAPVKYFLWVKTISCEVCEREVDLFSRHVVAKNQRHPNHVLLCPECRSLNEFETLEERDLVCDGCSSVVPVEGPAGRGHCTCPHCGGENTYPKGDGPPRHRLYAMEYHCDECYGNHDGRFFKAPDEQDFERYAEAKRRLEDRDLRFVPEDDIPSGDESDRLHRWGYEQYRQLFNDRQLLGLEVLSEAIHDVEEKFVREALLTVFSDTLRYQNMLCRYDTYALKIQDIFSVHGFPVGLTQCENSVLGVPGRGSGGFRHFVKKYLRAKSYCQNPYEYTFDPKEKVYTNGETIEANFDGCTINGENGTPERKSAVLRACSAEDVEVEEGVLDAVFTDPPYFANVQYAELMDFCYVWLRQHMQSRPEFADGSTRTPRELTVNETEGRGIDHFTEGMSRAYSTFANGLKEGRPFVFTYHHNEVEAYFPIAVALLDSGLVCTSALPSPAEMGASIHISGTTSSTLDTVFVCRSRGRVQAKYFTPPRDALERALRWDLEELMEADLEPTKGDAYCLLLGHVTRLVIWSARDEWDSELPVAEKLDRVQSVFRSVYPAPDLSEFSDRILGSVQQTDDLGPLFAEEPDADFQGVSDHWIDFEPAVV